MYLSQPFFRGLAALLCVLAVPAFADIFDGAPPAPAGFADFAASRAALAAGKVPLIQQPTEMPEDVIEEKDIEYGKGGDKALLLDLYRPEKSDAPSPAMLFIHGGGWSGGARGDYKFYTAAFAEQGYVAATITYRLRQEAPFPAALQDAKCAVRWLRANAKKYNIDPDRIAVIGGSAGGHLSLMVAYSDDPAFEGTGGNPGQSSRVQAVINFYGVTDLTIPVYQTADTIVKFVGKSYAEAPEAYTAGSPLAHLTKDDPPTLTFHGTIDELVPVAQADALHAKLKDLGIPNYYDRVEGWPHTMDLARDINARCRYVILNFLKLHLK